MRVYTEHKDITYLLVAILLNYVVGLVYINIDKGQMKSECIYEIIDFPKYQSYHEKLEKP